MSKKLVFLLLFFATLNSSAQETIIGATMHYMYQLPTGSIATQYGSNSNAGFGLNIKLVNNFTFGAEGQFMFASKYNDVSVLGSMVTSGGFIIGENNTIEIPELEGRGGNFFLEAGKIFPLGTKNLNSGLHIKAGVGYLFYSVYNNADVSSVTQLGGEYFNGYNRLESGWSLQSFIGYTLYSNSRLLNGSIGVQTIYTSTSFKGTADYATSLNPDQSGRNSLFIGPKIALTIALKRFQKKDPKGDGYFYN
jgi:hypothetical protein